MVQDRLRVMWLALGAALGTLGLKFGAYLLTGSVAIFSDAAESFINFTAAIMALTALAIAARPADATHTYGHEKAEYFSSGVEGLLILAAAAGISYQAWTRLREPTALEALPLGLLIAAAAALVNFSVARILLSTAKEHESITLEAHAKHLLADVWTTASVAGGLIAVMLTGWVWLDPLIAFAVAANIVISGVGLLRRSTRGLMDHALPEEEIRLIEGILEGHGDLYYHKLRTRRAGRKRFIDFHLLVPGSRTVQETHKLCEMIEDEIRQRLGEASITIHVEPLEDPASWEESR